MTASVAINDTMMAMAGMMVARQLPRNSHTTRMTSKRASKSVSTTEAMEASRKSFFDSRSSITMPGGNDWRMSSTSASICLMISLAFEPATWLILMLMPGLPFVSPMML